MMKLIEHSRYITSWIKASDIWFYSIDYEYWKAWKDRVRRSFNPDFFISINLDDYIDSFGDTILSQNMDKLEKLQNEWVEQIIYSVEIKWEDDFAEVTKAKEKYALDHFDVLNKRLRVTNPTDVDEQCGDSLNQHYVFKLLREDEYNPWFANLKNWSIL